MAAPYGVPPVAAAAAGILPFKFLMGKSLEQQGLPVPKISWLTGIKEGVKAAPTVGAIVGSQMILQTLFESMVVGKEQKATMGQKLLTSAIVGAVSSPVLAVFNGKTMGWTIKESLKRMTLKQVGAITGQETGFVAGVALAEPIVAWVKEKVGPYKVIEGAAAFSAGALGGLAGHAGNTALTRWQKGLTVEVSQLMWGSPRRTAFCGLFSLTYYGLKKGMLPVKD